MREIQRCQRIAVGADDLGWRRVAEKFREQRDQAANDGRIGIGAKVAAALAEIAAEPDTRTATGNPVGGSSLIIRETRISPCALHDGSEPLMRILKMHQLFD